MKEGEKKIRIMSRYGAGATGQMVVTFINMVTYTREGIVLGKEGFC